MVRLLSSRPWLQQPFCGSITGDLDGLCGSGQRFLGVPVAKLPADITYGHVHTNVNMLTGTASTALREHVVLLELFGVESALEGHWDPVERPGSLVLSW